VVDSPANSANYHWSFGNGNISIAQNPTQTYTLGKYKVSLETISKEGCIDSVTKSIQVGNVRADFSMPPVVCVNETTVFTNISGVVPLSATWRINGTVFKTGDGNAAYRFTAPGTYTVELEEDFGSCQTK
jgi:PKD repeat protein